MDILDVIEIIGTIIVAGILLIVVAYMIYSFVLSIYRIVLRISIRIRTKQIRYTDVVGIVLRKTHEREVTDFIWTGRFWMFFDYPEEFNVRVKYRSLTKVFDDEEIFDLYEKNEKISLVLVEKLNKYGEVIERDLELPE